MNGVELFTPFFSEAIAGYILKKHKLGTPLNIFELGNGSSTNLCALLNYMKTKMPEEVAEKVTVKSIVLVFFFSDP